MSAHERLGFLYIGKRPCGKVSAMSWDDPGYEKHNAKITADWLRRGLTVERIERFEGDPSPEWCDRSCKQCNPVEEGQP